MAKPLCVIRYHITQTTEKVASLRAILDRRMPDYHILIFPSTKMEDLYKIEVLNAEDATETTITELKQSINEELTKLGIDSPGV